MAAGEYSQNDAQVLAVLQQLEQKGQNTKPAMQDIAGAIHSRVMRGFKNSQSPYGPKWKKVKGRSGQPLRDARILQRSIRPAATAEEARVVAGGAASKYAAVHQFGATIEAKNHPFLHFKVGGRWVKTKSVTIPARPYLPIRPSGAVELPTAWASDASQRVLNHYSEVLG